MKNEEGWSFRGNDDQNGNLYPLCWSTKKVYPKKLNYWVIYFMNGKSTYFALIIKN